MILTSGCFQGHTVNLLLPGQVKTGGIAFVGIRQCCATGGELFLLPVDAATNRPVPNLNVITPLDIALFHIIQGGARGIAASVAAVVVIFDALIVSNQLGGIDTGAVTQTRIPGLRVILSFIIAANIAIRALIVVSIGCVTIAPEETREVIVKLMLHTAQEKLVTIAITIAVAAVRRIRLDVKTFCGLISTSCSHYGIAKTFINGAVISLITVTPHSDVNL